MVVFESRKLKASSVVVAMPETGRSLGAVFGTLGGLGSDHSKGNTPRIPRARWRRGWKGCEGEASFVDGDWTRVSVKSKAGQVARSRGLKA